MESLSRRNLLMMVGASAAAAIIPFPSEASSVATLKSVSIRSSSPVTHTISAFIKNVSEEVLRANGWTVEPGTDGWVRISRGLTDESFRTENILSFASAHFDNGTEIYAPQIENYEPEREVEPKKLKLPSGFDWRGEKRNSHKRRKRE